MFLVQLLLQRESYAKDLSALLCREGCDVLRCSVPDFSRDGAIVADRPALEACPALLDHPERVTLIAPNDQNFLSVLWQHKMRSVVFDTDPPGTVLLSILGAGLSHGNIKLKPARNNIVVIGSR